MKESKIKNKAEMENKIESLIDSNEKKKFHLSKSFKLGSAFIVILKIVIADFLCNEILYCLKCDSISLNTNTFVYTYRYFTVGYENGARFA